MDKAPYNIRYPRTITITTCILCTYATLLVECLLWVIHGMTYASKQDGWGSALKCAAVKHGNTIIIQCLYWSSSLRSGVVREGEVWQDGQGPIEVRNDIKSSEEEREHGEEVRMLCVLSFLSRPNCLCLRQPQPACVRAHEINIFISW